MRGLGGIAPVFLLRGGVGFRSGGGLGRVGRLDEFGFGRVDPLRAMLLGAALDHGEEGILWVPAAGEPLDRLLLATWGTEEQATDALAGTRQLVGLLGPTAATEPAASPPPPPLVRRPPGSASIPTTGWVPATP